MGAAKIDYLEPSHRKMEKDKATGVPDLLLGKVICYFIAATESPIAVYWSSLPA